MADEDKRHAAWRSEFESLGEEAVRMMDSGSQSVPDDKIRFSRVWLKQQEDSRAKHRVAEQLHERARQFRGRFLNHVVIERDIALLLTHYFCTEDPSKQAIFFDSIASAMSLNAKRLVLIEIVKKDYPRYWDEHSQFLLDLQRLQEFRNKLAHSVVDVSDAALERPLDLGVGFVQWKQGEPITEGELDDWVVRANMVLDTLNEIKMLLPFKERMSGRGDR